MPPIPRRPGMALACLLALGTPFQADPLTQLPDLAPDVAALPRLADDTATAGIINDALAEIDRRHLAQLTCDGRASDQPYRAVETLSDGPAYLTFLISLGAYCDGAAHPFSIRQLVTFDLASGLRTTLADLLPPDWSEPRNAAVQLQALYRQNLVLPLDESCLAILTSLLNEGYLTVDLGLDLRSRQLLLMPVGLPYAALSCESEAWVPPDQLRAAGFDPRLVQALTGTP
jgi:hypothetical protein